MTDGFSEEKIEVSINKDEVQKILKKYKKIQKYMRSPLFKIRSMDGDEKVLKNLLKELEEDPVVENG